MKLQAEIGGRAYHVALIGHEIAIPLDFDGGQPNTYGVARAQSAAYRSGGWVGDVRAGGSCNFETVQFTPHCNGTHTECIGHISEARYQLPVQFEEALVPATLISVLPATGASTLDAYTPAFAPDDLVIDRASLVAALPEPKIAFLQALVIRSLPNDASKCSRDYMQVAPAFFSLEAMAYLVECGVQHLLTDLPSVDRLFDEGKLSAHHVFWGIPQGSHTPGPDSRTGATITEMVFVPDNVPDGHYLLNLQTTAFLSDASPSRPVLHPLMPI